MTVFKRVHRALPLPALFSLVCLASIDCGAPTARPTTTADMRVVTSEPAPEVDALVDEFYSPAAASPAFSERLSAALAQHPSSGALQEVAAYRALLRDDDHAAWEHFLRAATDTRNSDAALDIQEATRQNRTQSEMIASVGVLDRIARGHPDPNVRSRATQARAGYLRVLGRLEEARGAISELGFVRSASVVGSFDNEDGKGFAEAYPPEAGVDLTATMPGSLVPVRWRIARASDLSGTLWLGDFVHPSQQSIAYVAVWVVAPADTEATLRLSTEASVAAWINRESVLREDRVRRFGFDNVTAPISLRAGSNELLVKSAIKNGSWALGIRVTDPAGNTIAHLATSPTPPAAPLVSPSLAHGAGLASVAAPLPRPPRTRTEAFHIARSLATRGLCQPALAAMEKLLGATGTSPLLRYFTADAARDDHQLERALDLYTAGISEGPPLPAFLEERADLYLQKDLVSQAERDLHAAVDQQPEARLARMALADVFARRGWPIDRLDVLSKVIERWPDSGWAHASLSAAREAQGYLAQAEDEYHRAVSLEPGNVGFLRTLRRLADRRQEDRAVEEGFARVAELDPIDIGDQLAHAEFDRTRGRLEVAIERLNSLSAQSPGHPTAYLRRGQIAEELGHASEAVAFYQQAQDRDPPDSWLAERLQRLKPPAQDALSAYVPSDEMVEAAVRRPPTQGDPASQIQTLLDDQATLLNADGSVRLVHTEVLRALTQRGRDELVRLPLPTNGQLRVIKAFAQTPQSQRQEASSVDRTSVRFRNLEVGSIVVLQFALYPRRGGGALADDFFTDVFFSIPSRHLDRKRWVLVIPKGKTIHVDADPRVRHTVTEKGAWVVREFVRENAPALVVEPAMVPVADLVPHVVVTTLPSWDSFIRWERAILDESFPADPAIDALAQRLASGATTPRDKLGKLFAFVAQEVRYQQEYESILAGWQPHRSSVVLERKYGDCKDKTTLLMSLARAVGIKLQFAVLATHRAGRPDRNVVLPTFNHAIAYAPVQPGIDEAFFLDATVDALDLWNLREDDQGAAGLVIDPESAKYSWVDIPYQPPAYQFEHWKIDVAVESPESAVAHTHVDVRGGPAANMRAVLRSEDQSRQAYELLASAAFPGGKMVSASAPDHESIGHPLAIDEVIDVHESIRQEGSHFRLKFPNDADNAPTKLGARQTPLDLGVPRSTRSEIVVHLNAAVVLVDKPAPVEVVDPCFRVTRTVGGDHATVTLTDDFERTCTTVSPEDYPRFRANMERARSLLDSAVVFDKAAAPAARAATDGPAR